MDVKVNSAVVLNASSQTSTPDSDSAELELAWWQGVRNLGFLTSSSGILGSIRCENH